VFGEYIRIFVVGRLLLIKDIDVREIDIMGT